MTCKRCGHDIEFDALNAIDKKWVHRNTRDTKNCDCIRNGISCKP